MLQTSFETLIYEIAEPGIARIRLNRPDRANAQDTQLLYELTAAFDRAAHDDEVRVIILAAEGKHFSAGHDLSETDSAGAMKRYQTVGTMCGFGCAGAEAQMSREEEIYVGFSERWRNIPKPTIAAVQGKCIAGGLMLASTSLSAQTVVIPSAPMAGSNVALVTEQVTGNVLRAGAPVPMAQGEQSLTSDVSIVWSIK